jgi:hypothetical protein
MHIAQNLSINSFTDEPHRLIPLCNHHPLPFALIIMHHRPTHQKHAGLSSATIKHSYKRSHHHSDVLTAGKQSQRVQTMSSKRRNIVQGEI